MRSDSLNSCFYFLFQENLIREACYMVSQTRCEGKDDILQIRIKTLNYDVLNHKLFD